MAKKCQRCGYENTDTMRFCLNCGATLPDAPTAPVHKTDAPTESFSGGVPPTNFGAVNRQTENFGRASGSFPPSNPTVLTPKPKSKIGLIIGGVTALLLLIGIAGGAIILYNVKSKKIGLISDTPTPVFSPTANSNSVTPRPSPFVTPDVIPSPNSSPTASFTPPLAATKTGVFTVYANGGWQVSEIDVVQLEKFRVGTTGLIDVDGVKTQIPAKGLNDKNSVSRRIYPEYPTGALLFRTRFADGHLGNVLPVSGANFQNFPDELGRLEFCVNDNAPQNNGGQFTVAVTMTSVPKTKK